MFGLFKDVLEEFRPKPKKETIVVAKPVCTPARQDIEQIFSQYGVKLLAYKETTKNVEFNYQIVPGLYVVTLKVSAKQAVWAEYLLLRSQKFMLMSKPKNARNLEWATKHKAMPTSWNGKPLIEVGCKEGLKALKGAKKHGK